MTATTAAQDTAAIQVSVVVPSNRLHRLARCVDALLNQTMLPAHYEIILIDDGVAGHARQLVAMWRARAAERGVCLRYLSNHGRLGPAAARNLGWRMAHGAIVAFTADRSIPLRTWLAEGLAVMDARTDAVCGHVEIPLPPRPTDFQRDASRLALSEFTLTNCFVRRSTLADLRGFDERFRRPWREDSDLYFRLLDKGASIVRAPRAVVIHPVRPAQWGVSLVQPRKIAFDALLYKKHPQRYREKIRATPRWDYYAIVAALLFTLGAAAAGSPALSALTGAAWLAMTTWLCARRLRGNSRHLSHVAEMVLTSALIPPLAVFWRLAGAVRFRVGFA